jgi:DNA-binding NtrC family response regulator
MTAGVGIVHGDELFRQSLGSRLQRARFRVYPTGDAGEMRAWLGRKRIDVVLIGLTSLGREALALVDAVARSGRAAATIVLNDEDDISLGIAAMKAGAYDEITVPFDMGDLVARVDEAWRAVRARRAARPRRSPLARARQLMVAISFAEAGELDTARSMMEDDHARPGAGERGPGADEAGSRDRPRRG